MQDRKNWKIGTIGFSYDDWTGPFFPPGLKPPQRLKYYATQFDFIELDTTFYALPTADTVVKWRNAVPDSFEFALKVPSVITHEIPRSKLKTNEVSDQWKEYLQLIALLKEERTTALFQLPPTFTMAHWAFLKEFLEKHKQPHRLAIEFRDESLVNDEVFEFLERRNIAWVAADLAPIGEAGAIPSGKRNQYNPLPWQDTADWRYLRLCGRHAQYESDSVELIDASPRIEWWLAQLGENSKPTIASCGNSFAGHGPATCRRLMALLGINEKEPMQDRLFNPDEL